MLRKRQWTCQTTERVGSQVEQFTKKRAWTKMKQHTPTCKDDMKEGYWRWRRHWHTIKHSLFSVSARFLSSCPSGLTYLCSTSLSTFFFLSNGEGCLWGDSKKSEYSYWSKCSVQLTLDLQLVFQRLPKKEALICTAVIFRNLRYICLGTRCLAAVCLCLFLACIIQ